MLNPLYPSAVIKLSMCSYNGNTIQLRVSPSSGESPLFNQMFTANELRMQKSDQSKCVLSVDDQNYEIDYLQSENDGRYGVLHGSCLKGFYLIKSACNYESYIIYVDNIIEDRKTCLERLIQGEMNDVINRVANF